MNQAWGVLALEVLEETQMKEAVELVRLYLARKEPNTSRMYKKIFEDWNDYIKKEHWLRPYKAFLQPSRKDVLHYYAILNAMGTTEQTVHYKMGRLKKIYQWLIDNSFTEPPNPFAIEMTRFRAEEVCPTRAIEYEQVERLCTCWKTKYDDQLKAAAMTLLFACAMRRSEVASLPDEDVELWSNPHIIIRHQKNKDISRLPVQDWALANLRGYRSIRVKTDASTFLVKRNGIRVSDSWVRWTFKEALKRCGLPLDKFSTRSARATSITKLLDDGCSHRQVMDFSRHGSIAMVERYDKRRIDLKTNVGNMLSFTKKVG